MTATMIPNSVPDASQSIGLLEVALSEAKTGCPVFMIAPGTKVPLAGTNGSLDATTDEATIRNWFARIPGANYGIALQSDDLVLDFDCYKPEGRQSLDAFALRYPS